MTTVVLSPAARYIRPTSHLTPLPKLGRGSSGRPDHSRLVQADLLTDAVTYAREGIAPADAGVYVRRSAGELAVARRNGDAPRVRLGVARTHFCAAISGDDE